MELEKAVYTIVTENSLNYGKFTETSENTRLSILCNYNIKRYLITAFHDIYKCSSNYICVENERIKIFESDIISLPEIDIILFDVTNYPYFSSKFKVNLNNVNLKINHIDDNFKLNVYDANVELHSTYIKYIQNTTFNLSYPPLLKYSSTIPCRNMFGISGGPIFDNSNNIIAIVSGYSENDNLMTSTPFFFIDRVLKEIDKYAHFGGLCGFYYDHEFINNYITITKKEDIDSNIYIKNLNIVGNSRLLVDDQILQIDGLPVNNNGRIYIESIGIDVDICSYINIIKSINDITKFTIFRPKNKTNKVVEVITGNRDHNSSLSTDLTLCNPEILWEENKRLYIKVNYCLWNFLIKNKLSFSNKELFSIFNMKISDKKDNYFLLIEDINLNVNIFDNKVENYIVKTLI